ncbi:LOW QUALITY PROTEIN: Pentatricopeptide repeat [Dillenia turbinata]|uniref:Pentatricopeptide repeat n=1 Tax=Dillenia turbinata TaxID=194707 RepID=A0AAN8ZGZ1_9MAGN
MVRFGPMPDSGALAVVVLACDQLGATSVLNVFMGLLARVELISMHLLLVNCGSLESAYKLFLELDERNVVVRNTLIHQCIEHNNLKLAKHLLRLLSYRDVVSWNTLEQHELRRVTRFKLIDMYAKCGNIDKAVQIFERSPRKNLFARTSTIYVLAMHGHGVKALHYFDEMREANVQPDDATIRVLNTCAMPDCYIKGGIFLPQWKWTTARLPRSSIMDVWLIFLGRIGCLKDAYGLIKAMLMKANEVTWGSLLSANRATA